MKPNLRIVPPAPAAVSPLLRWAGGKRWFVKDYGDDMFDHVIKSGGQYIEPFLGGGAMAFHLGLHNMILSDVEEEIMLVYTFVRDNPDQLFAMLNILKEEGTDKETFYRIRAADLNQLTPVEVAARCIYLNKLCFNGLFRKNQSGRFNVPYQGDPNRKFPTLDDIMALSRALERTKLRCLDFADSIAMAREGDTIYADPPYHETGVGYTANGFDDSDQERLAEALYRAKERGASFFAHNADTAKVRYWYEEWAEIISTSEKRKINSKGDERGDVPCVLIVGGVDV